MIAITPVQQPASSRLLSHGVAPRDRLARATRIDHGGSTDESADMKVLRQRLKLDARTKPGTLAAAAALAGDRSLVASKVFEAHKVPAGSQGRAKELAARIVRESLLDPDAEPSNVWLPTESLLVPTLVGSRKCIRNVFWLFVDVLSAVFDVHHYHTCTGNEYSA